MKDTRTQILETALGLFLQSSYREVTMKDIVEKTGLSKGAVYHYFESKEQLFLEIAEEFIFSMHRETFRDLPENSLRDFYRTFLKNVEKNVGRMLRHPFPGSESNDAKTGLNYYTMVIDAYKLFPEMREKVAEMDAAERGIWTRVISNAIKSGEIRTAMSADQLASIYMYTNDGIGIRILMEGKVGEMGPQLSQLWDAFYDDLIR